MTDSLSDSSKAYYTKEASLILTAAQAATALGVSPATMSLWLHAGRFPDATKNGRSWRIPFPLAPMPELPEQESFSVSDLAQFLGVTETTIRGKLKTGLPGAYRDSGKRGRPWVIPYDAASLLCDAGRDKRTFNKVVVSGLSGQELEQVRALGAAWAASVLKNALLGIDKP